MVYIVGNGLFCVCGVFSCVVVKVLWVGECSNGMVCIGECEFFYFGLLLVEVDWLICVEMVVI